MKENISPVVIAAVVIVVIAIVAFFGVKTFTPNRNAEPSADQIKEHMGAGVPQTGGMCRPGGPAMPGSYGGSGGSGMPGSGGSSGR